ncbi:hypothetical protein BpHYR1_044031 [Brachionus plicatilis]|uniref:Uncharacterized protein n=1 Tax=Brachionus plicatilis TaxID=10195 RepID=A0A3M7RT30_BRAPC|nr:hypothetical protein BpHYR1_044031 [Brachionus plicatilis]
MANIAVSSHNCETNFLFMENIYFKKLINKRCFTETNSFNFLEELKNSKNIKAFVISTSNKIRGVANNNIFQLNGASKAIAKYQNSPKNSFMQKALSFETVQNVSNTLVSSVKNIMEHVVDIVENLIPN